MMHFVFFAFTLFALHIQVAGAACPAVPSKDFSIQDKQYVETSAYTSLGSAQGKCLYFRDIAFKNGQGQQAIVVANGRGRCVGFFRTPLALGAELDAAELRIKSAEGGVFKVNFASAIPNKLFFDGELVELEACLK